MAHLGEQAEGGKRGTILVMQDGPASPGWDPTEEGPLTEDRRARGRVPGEGDPPDTNTPATTTAGTTWHLRIFRGGRGGGGHRILLFFLSGAPVLVAPLCKASPGGGGPDGGGGSR